MAYRTHSANGEHLRLSAAENHSNLGECEYRCFLVDTKNIRWTERRRIITIQYACAAIVLMTSFCISEAITVLVCPGGNRLSRAPPGLARPRDRATPATHSRRREGAPRSDSASWQRRKVISRGWVARSRDGGG